MSKRVSERLKRFESGVLLPPGAPPPAARPARIIVIGHKNPDTDAIAAAAGYAEFKRATGLVNVEAAGAGWPSARPD